MFIKPILLVDELHLGFVGVEFGCAHRSSVQHSLGLQDVITPVRLEKYDFLVIVPKFVVNCVGDYSLVA